MLNIVASYHRMEFHEKPMIQTLDMPQKTHFGSDLGPFGTNFCHQFFFFFFSKIWPRQSLGIMVSYHHYNNRKN